MRVLVYCSQMKESSPYLKSRFSKASFMFAESFDFPFQVVLDIDMHEMPLH